MPTSKTEPLPFFSIVIPTRDRADLLSSLIWSILDQDFASFEILLCDNSTNNLTQELLGKFNDDRILNIRTGNLGMSENYNTGINSASGKYLICISDKGLLKQGALGYLSKLILSEKHECITWALDSFVYPGYFFPSKCSGQSRSIESSHIIKFILGSDYRSYEPAPMHCTSCISMDLVKAIRKKHHNLCQAQNPDYTMAAQVLLATKTVYNLKDSLVILRNVSSKEGYGMGHSLAKKTKESRDFLKEHSSWIERTNKFLDVPIKDCPFIIDLMLKDTYTVFEDNNVSPDIFLSRRERLISYYFFTYEEIIWRTALGVNMTSEFKIWLEVLSNENQELINEVNRRNKNLRFNFLKARIKYLIKNNAFARYLLDIFRSVRYRYSGKVYKNIEDCYNNNPVNSS